jgi:hypothetical protein
MLQQQLEAARSRDAAVLDYNTHGTPIQVPGTGKTISTAYEQLRNAAEYTEDHLLLQRAIRRFYHRNISFLTLHNGHVGNIGEELIVELTLAGYISNGGFSVETATRIRTLAEEYVQAYRLLRDSHVSRDDAIDWSLSILAVETENLLNPHSYFSAIAYSSYYHFLQFFPKDLLAKTEEEKQQYEICLYIAVYQTLLNADISVVRDALMHMYGQSPDDITAFIQFNRNVDALYISKFTNRLKRAVNKHGAPMRIIKSLTDERQDLPELLTNRENFLAVYSDQVHSEYKRIHKRLNKGIIKSVIFILITKALIGIGIEVPYDLVVAGTIDWFPLTVNFLIPPVYMASLKIGLRVPTSANARALREYIDKALYTEETPPLPTFKDSEDVSTLSKWLFSASFFIPFGITIYILHLLRFNPVQGIVFFIFLSTASFFGYRLSSMVRGLELVTHQAGFLSSLRDSFYWPFIVVGRWLSSKYAKLNIVAYFLDIAIELPLKTVLRLIRQWTRFLNEKHDETY